MEKPFGVLCLGVYGYHGGGAQLLFSYHLSSIDSIQSSKEKQWLATTTEWRIDFALDFLSGEEHKNVSACFYLPHPCDVEPQLGVHVVLSGSRWLLVSISRIHCHCYL